MANEHFLYTVVDSDFYESLEYYTPDRNAYVRQVEKLLPEGWDMQRGGLWFTCARREAVIPEQGWKIHISATLANAGMILVTAARVLIAEQASFKFACDRFLFYLLNSKRWNRGGSGKFITIYPADDEAFRRIVEKLYVALAGYQGPYILSDRQYKDSRVIFYRYGGFKRMPQLTVKGTPHLMLRTPDGGWVQDSREAYYRPPVWAVDPLGATFERQPSSRLLKDGRYTIAGVITFSNSGGVYLATDRDNGGARVVIKEARPFSNIYLSGYDAVVLLKKEHRLLSQLEPFGIAPKPIDFFQEWEHWFLVQEFVDGLPLRGKASLSNIVLYTQPTLADVEQFCEYFRTTFIRITEIIRTLHAQNIVFTDLSHFNVLIRRDSGEAVLIDFEAAYERGIEEPTPMFTPGFASEQQQNMAVSHFEDDLYALGALMVASLTPMMAMSSLCPEAHERFLAMLVRDFGLPPAIQQLIGGLMHPTPTRRPKPAEVLALLSEEWPMRAPNISTYEGETYCTQALVRRIVSHILGSATYDRGDRLFPGDPELFASNPLGIAYGASGVAYALKAITGETPEKAVRWILTHECSPLDYAPGLYVGLSGIAWTLQELGQPARARELAALAHAHPLASDSADVFYGLAGTGLSQLKLFASSGDEQYLAWALETAERLLALRQQDESGCFWPFSGEIYYGMAHGASGVALFFTYLYRATREERYIDVARQALEYDLAHARRSRENALTWTMGGTSRTVTPYWRHGGAGVGTAMLRYVRVTGDPRFRAALDEIVGDCDRKYAIFPTRMFGLAGVGDFLLDMDASFPAEPSYRRMALKVASGISLFRVERPTGTAFPGEELIRLSCDYGTGSAGIALFLHRLLNGGPTPYMVDELLADHPASALAATATAPALTETRG
jgi:hypothetical protein